MVQFEYQHTLTIQIYSTCLDSPCTSKKLQLCLNLCSVVTEELESQVWSLVLSLIMFFSFQCSVYDWDSSSASALLKKKHKFTQCKYCKVVYVISYISNLELDFTWGWTWKVWKRGRDESTRRLSYDGKSLTNLYPLHYTFHCTNYKYTKYMPIYTTDIFSSFFLV